MNVAAEKLLQVDPLYYAKSIGFDPIKWQIDFLTSKGKKVAVLTSRQIGKSTTTAVKAVHRAKRAKQFIIIFAPTERQSLELMKKIEEIIALDPDLKKLPTESKHEKIFTNGSRIIAMPGNEKSARGFSAANLIIIDEASRVEDALFQTIKPILAASNGDLILLTTPFGKRGAFYKLWMDGLDWTRFEVPATGIPWMTEKFLEGERNDMGDYWFQQEYMCQFLEPEDSFFNMDDVMAAFTGDVVPMYSDTEIYSKSVEALRL